MRKALIASITALAALGLLGGCLVVARSGYTTSSKRGGWEIFVPAPEAYVPAALMFALSGIAVVWLLQQFKARPWAYGFAVVAYVGVAIALTHMLSRVFPT